ncbi:MAG: hypothetical protein JXA94_07250, partial [Parachlamydiales bacterium]|nr:hypothetical protein [Parachlamydiales bacterium]
SVRWSIKDKGHESFCDADITLNDIEESKRKYIVASRILSIILLSSVALEIVNRGYFKNKIIDYVAFPSSFVSLIGLCHGLYKIKKISNQIKEYINNIAYYDTFNLNGSSGGSTPWGSRAPSKIYD